MGKFAFDVPWLHKRLKRIYGRSKPPQDVRLPGVRLIIRRERVHRNEVAGRKEPMPQRSQCRGDRCCMGKGSGGSLVAISAGLKHKVLPQVEVPQLRAILPDSGSWRDRCGTVHKRNSGDQIRLMSRKVISTSVRTRSVTDSLSIVSQECLECFQKVARRVRCQGEPDGH